MKKCYTSGLNVLFTLLTLQIVLLAQETVRYQYLSPVPGAKYVSPNSTIFVRFNRISPFDLTNLSVFIEVRGEKSGRFSGQTIIASDKRTIIFKPESGFSPGEKVRVTLTPRLPASLQEKTKPYSYQFSVSERPVRLESIVSDEHFDGTQLNKTGGSGELQTGEPLIMENGVSVPGDFPHVNITVNDNPDSGYIFLNNWGPPNYNIIFENSGAPLWYWRTPDKRRDFKVQPNGWLTMLVRDGYGGSGEGYIALDQNYQYIKTFRTSNGYWTDEHELQVLPDGGYLLIGRREDIVNMSQYVPGGQPNAVVRETCIQEYTANDNLIFQWRAWDHFDITDLELEDLTSNYIRFPHMNAIAIDDDGHILLSSRHLSEITKINRQTGDIIWRMTGIPGSANNDFQFINDPLNGFRSQHSIRALGNGRYTLFDNGNLHSPPVSRAVEYHVDTLQMTATLLWEFQNDLNNHYSYYMGNAQRLPNGNTHINWARGDVLPIATEVRPNGDKAFEMWFMDGYHCYRSFRFPWQGKRNTPYLILEPRVDNITLLFNKFGDNDVDYYKIYGDTISQPTIVLDTSRSTMKALTNLENRHRYYFRVTAVDINGQESDFSNEEDIFVNLTLPGENIVLNGDFSAGTAPWIWEVGGSASAAWLIENGVSHIDIANGGNQVYEVQLRQNGIPLLQGRNYIFEFDAWADVSRLVEVKVGQDEDPWINYSRISFSFLTATPTHFYYVFEMQEPTDHNARVVINAGDSNIDVYIDNISLIMEPETGIADSPPAPVNYILYRNYPNPFNSRTIIQYDVPEISRVKIVIYNILGKPVKTLVDKPQPAGFYRTEFDASQLSSGIYFYKMFANSLISGKTFRDVKKMMFIK